MTHLDLFSGYGGFSIAMERCGFRTVAFAEIDPFASRLLAHRWPIVPNLGSVIDADFAPFAGVDVLTGGSPCQAFSVAGKRQSLADDRGNLTLRFVEIVHAIQPRVVLWENVPGVLRTKDNAFGCFLGALVGADAALVPPRECGGRWTNAGLVTGPERTAAWRILDAQHFGVPQRRRRVFVVSGRVGDISPAEILFELEGVRRDSASGSKARKDIAGTLGCRTSGGGRTTDIDVAGAYIPIQSVNTPREKRQNGIGIGQSGDPMFTMTGRDVHAVAFDQHYEPSEICPTLVAGSGGGGKNEFNSPIAFDLAQITSAANRNRAEPGLPMPPIAATGRSHVAGIPLIARSLTSNYGKQPDNSQSAPVLLVADPITSNEQRTYSNAGNNPKPRNVIAQSMGVRRLTPVECERLQGLPDNWTNIPDAADSPRYRCIGNGVAVPVVEWIARRIAAAIHERKAV